MAIAFNAVSTSGIFDDVTTSLTFSHTPAGSDRVLLVGVRTKHFSNAAGKATGVTFNSVAMTMHREFQFLNGPGDYQTLQVWRLIAPDVTTANVVVTMAGSPENGNAVALSFTGVDQTAPIEAAADTSGDAATAAVATVTTVSANAMMVSFLYSTDTSGTLGAGPTQRDQTAYTFDGADDFGASATQAVTTPAATTHTWTTTSNSYSGIAVSLREPSSGPDAATLAQYRRNQLLQVD